MLEKKISTYKQKDNTMISTEDLKLKITNLFSNIHPKNRNGFLSKMAEYDLYRKLDLSEDTLISQVGSGDSPEAETKATTEANTSDNYDLVANYGPGVNSSSKYGPGAYGYNSGPSANANANASANAELDEDDELAMLMGLSDVNKEFLERQLDLEEREFVETFAIPEGQTIYRRDEIVSELLDTFRNEGTGAIFSNEDKLKMWIDDMLHLVDDVSSKDVEGNITGAKQISSEYKPVVENFTNGEGTGVSWLIPISKEKKKVYDAGNDGDYYFSVDRQDETITEDRIVAADPKNTDTLTKYRGYDNQHRLLYEIGKPSRVEDSERNDGTHILDKEVYYVHNVQETGEIALGKRVLDKGLQRVQNIYENIGKKEPKKGAKVEAKKLYETLGRKRLVATEEVNIVEPEKITTDGFVVTKPGGKKLKPTVEGFYSGAVKEVIKVEEVEGLTNYKYSTENINPFRMTGERYAIIKQNPCTQDYYSLGSPINPSMIDEKSLPISGLFPGDKVVIRMTLPFINHMEDIVTPVKGDITTVPINVDFLVTYKSHILGEYGEDNKYKYWSWETKAYEPSDKPYCRMDVLPIYTHQSLISGKWENSNFSIYNPRIVSIFKNYTRIQEGDEVFMIFTDSLVERIVKGKQQNVNKSTNPYHSNTKVDMTLRNTKAIVLHKGVLEVEIQTTSGDFGEGTRMKMTRDDFDLAVVSKDISRAEDMYTKLMESESNYSKHIKAKPKIKITTDKVDKDAGLVWCKIMSQSNDDTMVQLLQSTASRKFGDYVMIDTKNIVYEVDKFVFESSQIGGAISWINGIFMDTNIDSFVPTLQEFLNKISKKLSTKESIHYSFIQDMSKLALDFEKYEITEVAKRRINMWVQWNLVKHVENMMKNNYRIHSNYTALLKLFEDTDEINPEKFRLNRGITPPDYSKWSVDTSKKSYTGIANVELVDEITDAFTKNTKLWSKLDIQRLTKKQALKLMEKKVPFEKKWNQIIHFKSQPKAKELKLIESIYAIKDPIVKSRILSEYIEKDCYLGEDSQTGTKWYYSKLDTARTKLVCPHVYLEIMGKPLTEYASEPIKDGTIVCKNCGQVLNSLVFSYFDGYEDEDHTRGRVTTVNGREIVGTMADTELVIEQKHVFSETENPDEYALEQVFDNYVSTLPPRIQQAIVADRDTKLEAINDCQFYILQYNITDFTAWYGKNKDVLLAAINKVTKNQSKIDELVRNKFNQYVTSRKNSIVLARLAIMAEKEVANLDHEEAIDIALKTTETRRIEKGEKPANLENIRKEVIKDYTGFTSSAIFPSIVDLYAASASEYEQEEEKVRYEDKFAEYTDSDINDNLSLFDALRWLKYYIRSTHKDQRIKGEVGEQECVPSVQDFHSYGTDDSQAATINKLEQFVASKMPNPLDRTGVKTRKQFYSSIVIEEPTLPKKESEVLEAKLIIKNLYAIPTSDAIMKVMYIDKATLEKKKAELKTYMEAVTSDINKYRMVDYLVTYKNDPITGQVVTRMYENGIETELGVSREELTAKYISMSTKELSTEFSKLKHSEIELEKYETPTDVYDCLEPPKPESMVSATIDKIGEKLNKTLGDKHSNEISKVMKMLREMEKEYVDGVYVMNKVTDKKDRKVVLYKEYERLSKMLTYLKRDYNYLANGVNLRERKAKLATKLDIKFKEGDQLEGFETEYDYIIKYMDAEDYTELRNEIKSLVASDVELVELTDCGVKDELEVMTMRNIRNKFKFCSMILKIILQMVYSWDDLKFSKYKNADKISNIDVELEFQTDHGEAIDRQLCNFIMEFIQNVNKLLRREEETFKGIEDYKERNFEIVRQMDRVKRMKFVDDIGSDLIREFSKVMKGKRVLDVGVKEMGSDSPLETAKVVDQEHYDVNPNGEGNYGTVFTNDLEGDHDDYNEEEAMDSLE
jgi:hypothetical protein